MLSRRVPMVFGLVLASVLAASCGDSARTASNTDTTDSSGVTIVRGSATDVPLRWTFAELGRIGGADTGVQSFDNVSPFSVATDGSSHVAVLDAAHSNQIHVFDSSGTWIRTVGRRGGGPGEMEYPEGIDVDRDGSVSVMDHAKQALLSWDPAGAVLPERKLITARGRPWGTVRRRGDTLYTAIDIVGDTTVQVRRLERWTSRDTLAIDSTLSPRPKMVMFKCVGLALPPLFSSEIAWTVDGDRLISTQQSAYVVDISRHGRRERSVRRDVAPMAAKTTDAAKLYPEGLKVRFGRDGECVTPSAEVGEKVGVAPTLPVIRAMVVAPDGTLWVERYTFADETPRTDVFDRDGHYLGTASGRSLPLGFLGPDVVLFPIKNDDDGTAVIGIYRIAR
ncbi:6-bladed beta-propeller [Gemmatimonas sp.]|uniref:6-bladed beta-propeller n=1 Tax=Gemmatimonas sp. TaxID=1962908 RepID=UPI00286D6E99|nr:6-bladed beta-propeller [Gemmatimonas sp.]